MNAQTRPWLTTILVRLAVVTGVECKYVTNKVRAMVLQSPGKIVAAKIRDRLLKGVAKFHDLLLTSLYLLSFTCAFERGLTLLADMYFSMENVWGISAANLAREDACAPRQD